MTTHRSTTTLLLLAAMLSVCACREPATQEEPTAKALPAEALDGRPRPFSKERTAAALNFWKPLSDRAKAVEEVAVVSGARLSAPEVIDGLEAVFRTATTNAPGVTEEFARDAVTLSRLGPVRAVPSAARLVRLQPSRSANLVRAKLIHPRSPAARAEGVPLFSARRAADIRAESFGIFSTTAPRVSEMTEAAERGAVFWLMGQERGDLTPAEAQPAYPRAFPMGEGDSSVLPLPLVFLPAAFEVAAMDTVNNVNAHWIFESVRAESAASGDAPILSARIRGHDSSRKLVVTCGRDVRPWPAGTGSTSLELACVLEVARTILAVMRTEPHPRPAIDLEFVWVMDRGAGYDWLPETVTSDETIVGVVNVQDVVPKNVSSSDVLLTFDGSDRYSAMERAFHQVVTSLAGEEGLWTRSALTAFPVPTVETAVAAALGQERLPVLRVGAASWAEDRALAPSPKYPPAGPSRSVADPVHPLVSSSDDEVRQLMVEQLTPQVMVARALAFGLLRTAEAFAP